MRLGLAPELEGVVPGLARLGRVGLAEPGLLIWAKFAFLTCEGLRSTYCLVAIARLEPLR